jgi:hypothetical protein
MEDHEGSAPSRLWRARRRHDRIDAVLRRHGRWWELQYLHNDRLLLTRRFEASDGASAEAASRLRELRRAGWTDHW